METEKVTQHLPFKFDPAASRINFFDPVVIAFGQMLTADHTTGK